MWYKKRRKTRKDIQNSLMNWLVIGLVVLAAINNFDKRAAAPSGVATSENTTKETAQPHDASSTALAPLPIMADIKTFKDKVFPDPQGSVVTVQDIEPGQGSPTVCGQKVTIAYQAFDPENHALDDAATKEKPRTFTVGQHEVLPALEQGVIGMKKKGLRNIFSPASLAYGAEGFDVSGVPRTVRVRFEAELLNIEPEMPAPQSSSFRFFDTQRGLGPSVTCGSTVKAHITVWNTQGEKIFSTRSDNAPLTVKTGSGSLFLGLEHSLLGMKLGGLRTAIVPPFFQKTLNSGEKTPKIPFPKEQTVLVDIETVE